MAVCGRAMRGRIGIDSIDGPRSEHVDTDDTLDVTDTVSSSRCESVSLAASWPHQLRGECMQLAVGVLPTLIVTVERPDRTDGA